MIRWLLTAFLPRRDRMWARANTFWVEEGWTHAFEGEVRCTHIIEVMPCSAENASMK